MADFYLEPNKFQEQIDTFADGAETIKALKYSLDEGGVQLESIDKYLECVESFNEVLALFGEFANQDAESMRQIKAKWMNKDTADAKKTLWQLVFGL